MLLSLVRLWFAHKLERFALSEVGENFNRRDGEMSGRWKVAIAAIVVLAVYSAGVTWYSVSHSADLEARLESKRVWNEELFQAGWGLLKENAQFKRDLAVYTERLEAARKELPTYRDNLSRERAEHSRSRAELSAAKGQIKELERHLNDTTKKLSGDYQREAQGMINRFVWSDGAYWEGLALQEDLVFGVDFADGMPTVFSTRWAMIYYDDSMKWIEKDARDTGHYYGFGNLGDVVLQRLEHVVLAAQKGLIPRIEAEWRIDRMERYARPGDRKTWELLGHLRENLSS